MNNQNLALFAPALERKQSILKQRLTYELDLPKLFQHIDNIYELNGAGISYIDSEFTVVKLREFQPLCHQNPIHLVLREPQGERPVDEFAASLKNDQRESQLVGELVGTGLSCGAAILSWVVVMGSTVAIPISGGTSAAVTYLGYAAAVASGLQCANGIGRTVLEVSDPHTKDWFDSQEWYTNASHAVDVISLAGVAASSAAILKTVHTLKKTTSKSTLEVLKGLSRHERKRLTTEVIRLNNPGVSGKVMKALVRAGRYPKRFPHQSINQALQLKLKEAIAASFSFSGSALTGSARALAVGVYEEVGQ
tara:strand:+ start:982 stop:1905 length:924 start_codon:yes stop_codon:yes gene_type:complete